MEAGPDQVRRVSDVMEPCRAHQQAGILADDVCDRLGLTGDALGVCPAARQRTGEQSVGEVSGPRNLFHMFETSEPSDQGRRTNRPFPWIGSTSPAPSSSASA